MEARRERALREHMFLVDFPQKVGRNKIVYRVCGSRGVIYQLTVSEQKDTTCTCLDFKTRGCTCKHIFCLLFRMLRFPINENEEMPDLKKIWERAQNDVKELFSANPLPEYKVDVVKLDEVSQRDWKGEDCGICCEPMKENEVIVYCRKKCGKSIHKMCLQQWQRIGKQKKCIFCRSDWM
jgi:hypothetical protein